MELDYEKVQACLGFAPIEVIKKMFAKTTQYARNIVRLPLRTHLKSRFPAFNVRTSFVPCVDVFRKDCERHRLVTSRRLRESRESVNGSRRCNVTKVA